MNRTARGTRLLTGILSLLLLLSCSTAGTALADSGTSVGSLPPEIAVHCGESALAVIDTGSLAQMVDMVKYKVQPQAVELLRTKFPVFEEAARMNQLGRLIGLNFIYDDSYADGLATADYMFREDEYGNSLMMYRITVNARSLVETDTDDNPLTDPATGKLRLTADEDAITALVETVTHEMMHIFMCDYNRAGTAGHLDPSVFYLDLYATEEEAAAMEAVSDGILFPIWFKEGYATAVENQYAYRCSDYSQLCCDGGGEYGGWYSPQILRNAASMEKHALSRDCYVIGYLACLYLAELAENSEGRTSLISEENGISTYDSGLLRNGLNTILRLLHEGLTLDDVIYNLSDGRFYSTMDFEESFLLSDDDSAVFCSSLLNYFRWLSLDNSRQYLPNGSVLFPFDQDYDTTIDRTRDASSDLYRIVDSSDHIPSTADLSGVWDAGTSLTWQQCIDLRNSGWLAYYDEYPLLAGSNGSLRYS